MSIGTYLTRSGRRTIFATGFSLLMDGEAEEAAAFFTHAVHFVPKNPRYRAYFGKALSSDKAQRHKAEAELQAAINLEPDNLNYKIMLVEFFIQFNLLNKPRANYATPGRIPEQSRGPRHA